MISSGSEMTAATLAGSSGIFWAQSAAATAVIRGANDTIVGSSTAIAATLSGSHAIALGEAGSTDFVDEGSNDTITGGSGAETVSAQGQGLAVLGGSGNLDFVGGASGVTIVSGSGVSTVHGGSGGTVLDGGAGSAIVYFGTTGSLSYTAGAGNETLNASAATTNNLVWGGSDTMGHNLLVGGSGKDTLVAGTGTDTLAGGGTSADLYLFFESNGAAAPYDVVENFNTMATVWLNSYGSGAAATALADATSSGGSTTLTLSDNTQITFAAVASVSELQGHVVST